MFVHETTMFFVSNSSTMTIAEAMGQGRRMKQAELSMRGTGVLRWLGGNSVAVGGADGVIDIMTNSNRVMTLIP